MLNRRNFIKTLGCLSVAPAVIKAEEEKLYEDPLCPGEYLKGYKGSYFMTGNPDYPEIPNQVIDLDNTVKVEARRLQAKWSYESEQDLRVLHPFEKNLSCSWSEAGHHNELTFSKGNSKISVFLTKDFTNLLLPADYDVKSFVFGKLETEGKLSDQEKQLISEFIEDYLEFHNDIMVNYSMQKVNYDIN